MSHFHKSENEEKIYRLIQEKKYTFIQVNFTINVIQCTHFRQKKCIACFFVVKINKMEFTCPNQQIEIKRADLFILRMICLIKIKLFVNGSLWNYRPNNESGRLCSQIMNIWRICARKRERWKEKERERARRRKRNNPERFRSQQKRKKKKRQLKEGVALCTCFFRAVRIYTCRLFDSVHIYLLWDIFTLQAQKTH